LSDSTHDSLAAQKTGVDATELTAVRDLIKSTAGDVVLMFGGELGSAAQAVIAQLASSLQAAEGGRILLHPLPLYNNSIGAHDMGMMERNVTPEQILEAAGSDIRALYVAGSFVPTQLQGREDALDKLDFLVVQELFHNDTTAAADVVLPAASYAEVDGTFTNNDGLVQRVRQSIDPLHQSKSDWIITAQLANELGLDFGYQMSSSSVFREIGEKVPAYAGLRYPMLKDESKPVQVKHALSSESVTSQANDLKQRVDALTETGDKDLTMIRHVGHELFKIGTLTDKVPQFHLLASGNPRPETTRVSPLYQITVDGNLRASAGGD